MNKPVLSVLITSYKKASLLKLCIEAFQKTLKNFNYEIIVADSETTEEVEDLMREVFPKIKFVANKKNVGFGVLVNQLLKKAQGEFYFLVNADIIVKDDVVQELIKCLKKDEKIGIIGPRLINFDNSIQPSFFKFYRITTVIYRRTFLKKLPGAQKELDRFLMKNISKNKSFEADWLMGSALMLRAETARKIGPMDNRFFMYFEDVDWCWRAWENGFKVIHNPLVKVYHYHGKQSANKSILKAIFFNKYARIHIQSAIKFFWKHKTLGWKLPY